MSVLKLNLEELLENMNNKTSLVDSELSGGKGKKRLKKKSKKPKRKPKKDEGDEYDEESEKKGFFSKLFGSKKEESEETESDSFRPGRGMGLGRGMCIKLQEEVEQLKDVIANLEEKILMLENRMDNL